MASQTSEKNLSMPALAIMLPVHLLALVALFFVLAELTPKYQEFYELKKLELPVITEQVFRLSISTIRYWYLVFPLATALDAAVLFVLSRIRRWWVVSLWTNLLMLVIVLLLAWIFLALSVPIIALIQTDVN